MRQGERERKGKMRRAAQAAIAWCWRLLRGEAAALAALTVFLTVWQLTGMESPAQIQRGIAGEVLRFHVLANSDSEEDQALKAEVKDVVLDFVEPHLDGLHSRAAVKEKIEMLLPAIEARAERLLAEKGSPYPVQAALTICAFPEKTYGDCTLPAGDYEALQVVIGAGGGQNWWCILFPGLCFTDCVRSVVPEEEKEELRNLLTEEEYRSIFRTDKPYTIKFSWQD